MADAMEKKVDDLRDDFEEECDDADDLLKMLKKVKEAAEKLKSEAADAKKVLKDES
jgi:hypothetical protein